MELNESEPYVQKTCVQCNGVGIGCPLCQGKGYHLIGYEGSSTKVFIEAPEQEKDRLVTQLGKIKEFLSPDARREYSMAYLKLRAHTEMAGTALTDEFELKKVEISNKISEYKLDNMKPIVDMAGLIYKMQTIIGRLKDFAWDMALNYESAIKIINAQHKDVEKKLIAIQDENKKLKKAITKALTTGSIKPINEEPVEENEEYPDESEVDEDGEI